MSFQMQPLTTLVRTFLLPIENSRFHVPEIAEDELNEILSSGCILQEGAWKTTDLLKSLRSLLQKLTPKYKIERKPLPRPENSYPDINCTKAKAFGMQNHIYNSSAFKFTDGSKMRVVVPMKDILSDGNVEVNAKWKDLKVNIWRYDYVWGKRKVARLHKERILGENHVKVYAWCEKEDLFVDEYLAGGTLAKFRDHEALPNFLDRLIVLLPVLKSIVDLNRQGLFYSDFKWTQWRQKISVADGGIMSQFKLVDLESVWYYEEWAGWFDLRTIYYPHLHEVRSENCQCRKLTWCTPWDLANQSGIYLNPEWNCSAKYQYMWDELLYEGIMSSEGQRSPYKVFQTQSFTSLVRTFLVPKPEATWKIPNEIKDDLGYLLSHGCDVRVQGMGTDEFLRRLLDIKAKLTLDRATLE